MERRSISHWVWNRWPLQAPLWLRSVWCSCPLKWTGLGLRVGISGGHLPWMDFTSPQSLWVLLLLNGPFLPQLLLTEQKHTGPWVVKHSNQILSTLTSSRPCWPRRSWYSHLQMRRRTLHRAEWGLDEVSYFWSIAQCLTDSTGSPGGVCRPHHPTFYLEITSLGSWLASSCRNVFLPLNFSFWSEVIVLTRSGITR